MSTSEEVQTLEGFLEVRAVDVGSKGEMPAAVLMLDERSVPLRRAEAVMLDVDPELAAYDGQPVRVTGRMTWRTFVVDTIEAI